MATNIVLTDLTNGALDVNNEWSGTGVFDVLMKAVNQNIEGQYNKTRITGTDYATVYLGAMQSVIAQSMQYLLTEKKIEAEIDLMQTQDSKIEAEVDAIVADTAVKQAQSSKDLQVKDGQIAKLTAEIGKVSYETSAVLPAQKALIVRQAKGFDDDAKQKLLKQTLDSWSVAYSVAQDANSIPDTIKVNIIDSVMKDAMDNLSITKAVDPLGQL